MNLPKVKASKFDVSNDLIDSIDPNEVVELFNSQLNQALKRWKLDFDGKNPKKSYDATHKFHIEWATKLSWAKDIVLEGGFIHTMRCRVWLLIEGKDKIVGCKWDTLTKHQCHKIAHHDLPRLGVKKGGEYITKDCAHLKNMKLYAQRGPHSILA
jgi:hypothetical protein